MASDIEKFKLRSIIAHFTRRNICAGRNIYAVVDYPGGTFPLANLFRGNFGVAEQIRYDTVPCQWRPKANW